MQDRKRDPAGKLPLGGGANGGDDSDDSSSDDEGDGRERVMMSSGNNFGGLLAVAAVLALVASHYASKYLPAPKPRIIGIDRGTDGKPCAGPNAEPCYNYSWAPSCTKAGGVNTETMWGSLCCAAGGCSPQEGNASAVGRLVHSFVQQKVPADFTGNCVLDCEGWNALTTDTTFGTCDSDPDFGIPNL